MKDYLVFLEAEEYISVEAEDEEEAVQEAIDIVGNSIPAWKATIIDEEEIEESDLVI